MGDKRTGRSESVRISLYSYKKIQELSNQSGIPKGNLVDLAIELLMQECGDAIKAFGDPSELKRFNALLQEKQKGEE